MAHPLTDPSDSPEDFLARNGLLTGELSPDEFAEHLTSPRGDSVGPLEMPPRYEATGSLYRRGEWSPLRRAWFCLQVAGAAALFAAYIYLNGFSLRLTIPVAAIAASSLSLGLLLLARSSAVYEIRSLSRDRRFLRAEARAYAMYAESLRGCVSTLAEEGSERRDSGAPLVRNLLTRARRSLVAAGHKDATLLVLRHESDRSLLTYSALPGGYLSDSSSGCRHLEASALQSARRSYPASHATELHLSGHRQELLALSTRPFRACDRLALDQIATCLSLAAVATSVAQK